MAIKDDFLSIHLSDFDRIRRIESILLHILRKLFYFGSPSFPMVLGATLGLFRFQHRVGLLSAAIDEKEHSFFWI
jgi:hypothetical protein